MHWTRLMVGALAAAASLQTASAQLTLDPISDAQVREQLTLRSYELVEFEMPTFPVDGGFDAPIRINGEDLVLDMLPYTMRSNDFKLIIVDEFGRREVTPPPPNTYRGEAQNPETGEVIGRVYAAVEGDQLNAELCRYDDHSFWEIQPLTDVFADADPRLHLIFNDDDILPIEGICGVPDFVAENASFDVPAIDGDNNPGSSREAGDEICEISVEGDFRYWQDAGGTRKVVIRDLEKLMIRVENRYEISEIGITYELSTVLLRKKNADDPYTTTDPGSLLDQFRDEWEANEDDRPHDVVHLLTGRNLDDGVIGIAWVGEICDNNRNYGLSETFFNNNINPRANLTAHELGHNWSSGHCDGDSDCRIMCSVINGCENGNNFGTSAINSIVNHKNSRNCLTTQAPDPTLPLFCDFESGIDPSVFTWVYGASTSTAGTNEPSGSNSLLLDSPSALNWEQNTVRSNEFPDMANFSNATLSYWTQHKGVEAGERLIVQYFRAGKNWNDIQDLASDGIDQTDFEFHSFAMPEEAFHDIFRFRFRCKGDSANDDWYVDDVSFTASSFLYSSSSGGDDEMGTVTLTLVGAPANSKVVLFGGYDGLIKRPFNPNKGMELDLDGQPMLLGTSLTNSQGMARMKVMAPETLDTQDLYIQALILDESNFSNSETAPAIKVERS